MQSILIERAWKRCIVQRFGMGFSALGDECETGLSTTFKNPSSLNRNFFRYPSKAVQENCMKNWSIISLGINCDAVVVVRALSG